MNLVELLKTDANHVAEIIEALKNKVASLQTTDNEKHVAFETIAANWNTMATEAEKLLGQFEGVEGDEKDALDRIKTLVSGIKGGTQTVLHLGLNNLPDAVKEPANNPDSPAAAPTLTVPVTAQDVTLNAEKEIVAQAKPTAGVVQEATNIVKRAVDVVANEAKTGIQTDTKTDEKESDHTLDTASKL